MSLPQSYLIRTAAGTLVARATCSRSDKLLNQLAGHCRTYTEVGEQPTVCYEVTEDTKWGLDYNNGGFSIYLFKGCKIIKD